MRQHYPIFFWNGLFEIFLDLFGCFILCEAEALTEPRNVRIDDDARCDSECVAHNDVCGLSCNSAERKQVIHRIWDVAAVNINYASARGLNILGLVSEKSCRVNVPLKLGRGGVQERLWAAIFPKKVGSDDVHSGIRALGRQDRCDKEFEGVCMVESAVCVGIFTL